MDIIEMKHIQQSLIRTIWNFGIGRQRNVSHRSVKILVLELIFLVPDPLL